VVCDYLADVVEEFGKARIRFKPLSEGLKVGVAQLPKRPSLADVVEKQL
jgi:hypothetical protein